MDDIVKTRKEHGAELFPRFAKASLRGFISFFLIFPAIACTCVFDAVDSKDGLALSMIVACFFLLVTVWYGVKVMFLFLKYTDEIRFGIPSDSKKESASVLSEKQSEAAGACDKKPNVIDTPDSAFASVAESPLSEADEEFTDDSFDVLEKKSSPQEIVVRNKSIDELLTIAKIAGVIWLFS